MTNIQAIRNFFEEDGPGGIHGRKVELHEMKALSKDDRAELGAACALALGATIDAEPEKLVAQHPVGPAVSDTDAGSSLGHQAVEIVNAGGIC